MDVLILMHVYTLKSESSNSIYNYFNKRKISEQVEENESKTHMTNDLKLNGSVINIFFMIPIS
jgi:hypothetical protein